MFQVLIDSRNVLDGLFIQRTVKSNAILSRAGRKRIASAKRREQIEQAYFSTGMHHREQLIRKWGL